MPSSRSGFTSGYLDGKINGTMFGTRSEADAEQTRKTLPALRELYRRERSRVPVEMKLEVSPDGEKLTVTDLDGNRGIAYGETEPQPARNDPAEALRRSLSKTAAPPLQRGRSRLRWMAGPGICRAAPSMSCAGRALDSLLKKREVLHPWKVEPVTLPALTRRTWPPKPQLWARFETWDQVPREALGPQGPARLMLPIAEAAKVPEDLRSKVILELPRAMFGAMEEDTIRRVGQVREQGFAGFEANNIAHLRICQGLPVTGGIGLNITNPLAAQVYADWGPVGPAGAARGEGQRDDVHRPGAQWPAGAHRGHDLWPHAPDADRACPCRTSMTAPTASGKASSPTAKPKSSRAVQGRRPDHLQSGAPLYGGQAGGAAGGLWRGLFHHREPGGGRPGAGPDCPCPAL